MSTFPQDVVDLLDATREARIETRAGARTVPTIIWVVVHDHSPYIRSYLGADGRWYQRALAEPGVVLDTGGVRIAARAVPIDDEQIIAAVSDAFRAKYSGTSMEAMVAPEVLAYTMRLDP